MSTRCQLKVIQMDVANHTLYHHTDGYTEHMIPLIARAFEMEGDEYNRKWRRGRAGKAASYLCAAEPGVTEPESVAVGDEGLHGDIEYLYRIWVTSDEWHVAVLVPDDGFWDSPSETYMKVMYGRQPLYDLLEKVQQGCSHWWVADKTEGVGEDILVTCKCNICGKDAEVVIDHGTIGGVS